ncbi:MAG: fibronectin type III domain-containing protein [Fimbriimonadales bacterium]
MSERIRQQAVLNTATVVGSATSASTSDYVISGLTPGTQYWMRVRPVRGSEVAPWSDPATKVALL